MTREEGCEWYQSNHYDFAYSRWCFLDTLKGLVSRCKSQKTGFSVKCKKHVASALMGPTLPKSYCPDYTSRYCCRTGSRPVRPLPPPNRTHSGRTATWRRLQVALWAKLLKYRTLVAVSAIWAHLLRRQVAYGYMGCSAMCHLGTNFLVP